MTEKEKAKEQKDKSVLGIRIDKETEEWLKSKGKDKSILLRELFQQAQDSERRKVAGECELQTLDWIERMKGYVKQYEKDYANIQSNPLLPQHDDTRWKEGFLLKCQAEVEWGNDQILHYTTICMCGSKRHHKPEDQGQWPWPAYTGRKNRGSMPAEM